MMFHSSIREYNKRCSHYIGTDDGWTNQQVGLKHPMFTFSHHLADIINSTRYPPTNKILIYYLIVSAILVIRWRRSRNELVIKLNIDDIDFSLKEVFIRDGKDSSTWFYSRRVYTFMVKKYLELSGLGGKGFTPHSLQNGADIRYVQELLDYDSIQTTVGYTKYIVKGLKKIHKTYHPREKELYPDYY